MFDKVLPKNVAVSCINRQVGYTPVDAGFADVQGRSKWAIPWLEDDPALSAPQLWAGRMRRDAYDALRYGCDGLMGIHWRTRALGPNIGALAQAAWDQGAWAQAYKSAASRPSQPEPLVRWAARLRPSRIIPSPTPRMRHSTKPFATISRHTTCRPPMAHAR